MIGGDRNQLVSLHTSKGVQLYQYNPTDQFSLGWGREKNNVSKCELSVPSQLVNNVLPDIVPWQHWVSVWDEYGKRLHWTGPVMSWSGNRDQLTISCADSGSLFKRQVNPITKRWEAADPAFIAGEIIESMLEQQGIPTQPLVRPDPRVDKFDFSVIFEEQMVDQTISQLVDVGLCWSVTMGRPILGPLSFKTQAALDGERDFMDGSPVITRDGADMANEIILRSTDSLARARVPLEGLNLQRIVHVENMFGVSNTQKVTNQYVRETSRVRDTLQLPQNVRLHPDAPVDLDMLVPTARFMVEAYGVLAVMELTAMEVRCSSGEISVGVTMASVDDDPPELEEFTKANGIGGLSGGGA